MKDFDLVIDIDGKNFDAYYSRGISKINLRKKDEGCYDLSKAVELGHPSAYKRIKEFCN